MTVAALPPLPDPGPDPICSQCGQRTDGTSPGTRIWTPDELAVRWDVQAEQIRYWCKTGVLPHQKIGDYYRIPGVVVDRWERCMPLEDSTTRRTA